MSGLALFPDPSRGAGLPGDRAGAGGAAVVPGRRAVKAVSLFSGAGGADLGMTEAGIETVLNVEYDASAVATCHAAGLDHVQLGDVRDLSLFDGLEGVDLVYGGPPCQAFSSAGKREGQDSELNGWPWALAVVDQLKPRWVVFENVPGLLHHSAECKHT